MNRFVSLLSVLGCLASFFSCSPNVDLYSDYKDIPIVYGLVDYTADTNFVKITKAFCGTNDHPIDATQAALISDSSNYPGKLDVYIVELQSSLGQPYQTTGRKFFLDTITIHNKETGTFYAPDQKLYYTTEQFKTKSGNNKYKYELFIIKPDGDTVTATTTPVGGDAGIYTRTFSFQKAHTNETEDLLFRPAEDGVLYELEMQFNYREQHPGQAMTRKQVSWKYGAKPLYKYDQVGETVYLLKYSKNTLFNALKNAIGNDTIWDTNHPNVTRYMDDFVIVMSAAGREYYENYEMSLVLEDGNAHSTSAFSNINGGFGLFSSRIKIRHVANLSARTKSDLFSIQSWGFQEE